MGRDRGTNNVGRSELGYLAVVTSVGATNLIPPARTHNKEPSGGERAGNLKHRPFLRRRECPNGPYAGAGGELANITYEMEHPWAEMEYPWAPSGTHAINGVVNY
jgi:hypothetical protein